MRTAKCRKIIVLVISALLPIFSGCSDSSSENGNGASSNALADNSPASATTIRSLFKDNFDFAKTDVEAGSTNCKDITDKGDTSGLMVAWPEDLKIFLTEVLSSFPAQQLITASVHGIYLVPNSTLYDSSASSSTAGLACDRGSDYKGLIFLNYNTVVQKRSSKGVNVWQTNFSVSNKAISVSEGDAAAVTLIHDDISRHRQQTI